jgi:hypothetical protein
VLYNRIAPSGPASEVRIAARARALLAWREVQGQLPFWLWCCPVCGEYRATPPRDTPRCCARFMGLAEMSRRGE